MKRLSVTIELWPPCITVDFGTVPEDSGGGHVGDTVTSLDPEFQGIVMGYKK